MCDIDASALGTAPYAGLSYASPFSAAMAFAFAMASAMLTVPELTGFMLLRSTLPECVG